jgi:phosphoglycerol transferase MdoB-like AlkP superfamily enzyme
MERKNSVRSPNELVTCEQTLTLPLFSSLSGWPRLKLDAATVLRPLLWPSLCIVAVLWLSRAGLAIWQAPRLQDSSAWTHLVLQGIRFDAVLLGMLWVLPATLTPWMALHRRAWRAWLGFLKLYGLAALVFVAFMELSTPAFVSQYDARPNYLFVEYLGYAKEVGGTLLKDHWPHLLATALLLPTMIVVYLRMSTAPRSHTPIRRRHALVLSLLLMTMLALSARGSLGHRPANPASAAVTGDHLVNELPLSSAYTVLYALYLSRKNEDGGITYATLPRERVIEVVRRETGFPPSAFTNAQVPLSRWQASTRPRQRPLNLVIVLEESLGAEFVGRLGGLPLTPHLDRLADEGIWFEQLYATGTRSVRGIEAVVAGYPPTSAVSTVKLAKSQRDFFTLAGFLKGRGYESTFFYGGESHFDNMRGFFMGNGFDQVIDEKDFGSDAFIGTWGASDSDVLKKAHQHFLGQPADKPFFGLIFTSSNHAPFEFPEGPATLYEQPRSTVNNAVQYADHALGSFIATAKTAPYWRNTLFLIVADHNSRVYGSSLIPIERFHIPGLIVGGPIQQPQRFKPVASQIDLAPTLLSLMGISGEHPMIGRDLSLPGMQEGPGRAIMQFDKIQAYREGSKVVVLQPDQPALALQYVDERLLPAGAPDAQLLEKAVAHALYAQMAYRETLHR